MMNLSLLLILCVVVSLSDVESASTGSVNWSKYGTGSFWHVFRQVHASEVANRQLLSSSRIGSSKVAETTRIIPKEQRRSEPSFTIISRIKSPWEQMLAYITPKPSSSWTSLAGRRAEQAGEFPDRIWPKSENRYMIGEAEPVVEMRPAAAAIQRDDGVFSVENGLVRYRGSHDAENETDGGSDESQDVPEPFPTFGLWEMMKKTQRPQSKWNVLNKLLIQPTSTETPTTSTVFEWNATDEEHLETSQESTTETNSPDRDEDFSTTTTSPDVTTLLNQLSDAERSQSVVEDSGESIPSELLHLTAVRIDDSTLYAVTHSLPNGTVVFQRIDDAHHVFAAVRNASDMEMYYPGFSRIAGHRPDRIWIHSSIQSSLDTEESWNGDITTTENSQHDIRQEVVAVDPALLPSGEIVSSSSPSTNDMAVYPSVPAKSNENTTEEGISSGANLGFRMMDDNNKPVGQGNQIGDSVHHLSENVTESTVVSNVTVVPSNSAENQMTPPLLKTLENLLLTHLLPPASSSAVTSSTPLDHLLHHEADEPGRRFLDDSPTTTDSHLIQTVAVASPSLVSSTTALPEAILQEPASSFYDPAINEDTLSSHSVIIPVKKSSVLQLVPSVQSFPSPWKWNTDVSSGQLMVTGSQKSINPTTTTAAPVDQTTIKSESTVTKPPLKKPGLASILLAHTANLVSGKHGSFFNNYRSKSNHFQDDEINNQTQPTVVNAVHVIMATPLRDAEEEESDGTFHHRAFQLNSTVNETVGNSSSWNFPSLNQLAPFPLSLANNISESNPVWSSDRSQWIVGQLPAFPRFTCGQQTTANELVLTNPRYPLLNEDANRCAFRLLVTSNHVCQVRVEFRDSRMLKPRQGYCVDQYLSVSESTPNADASISRPFCGWNTDQHFYLQLSEQPTPRYVDFLINTKAAGLPYRYSLVIQQIDCHHPHTLKAPVGCLQYFPNSETGLIKSFNFDGGQYWNNQNYKICVRSIDASCSLTLSSDNGDFGIKTTETPNRLEVAENETCLDDYLYIPGSISSDEMNSHSDQVRYCGTKFSSRNDDTNSTTVTVRSSSSVYVMEFRSGTSSTDDSRQQIGFRIKYESLCPPSETTETIPYVTEPIVENLSETTTVVVTDVIDDTANNLHRRRSSEYISLY